MDLQKVFSKVIEDFDCIITCGHRNADDQHKAFLAGNSKLDFPNSKHNSLPSKAVDAMPYPIDWKDIQRIRYFAGFVMGVAANMYERGEIVHQLRWGGDWDSDTEIADNKFNDLVHFEIK